PMLACQNRFILLLRVPGRSPCVEAQTRPARGLSAGVIVERRGFGGPPWRARMRLDGFGGLIHDGPRTAGAPAPRPPRSLGEGEGPSLWDCVSAANRSGRCRGCLQGPTPQRRSSLCRRTSTWRGHALAWHEDIWQRSDSREGARFSLTNPTAWPCEAHDHGTE